MKSERKILNLSNGINISTNGKTYRDRINKGCIVDEENNILYHPEFEIRKYNNLISSKLYGLNFDTQNNIIKRNIEIKNPEFEAILDISDEET